MRKLLLGLMLLCSCGLVGAPKLNEKQQRVLEDKSNEVQYYIGQLQRETQTKAARKERELEAMKEDMLRDLRLDPSKYCIRATGPSFEILPKSH